MMFTSPVSQPFSPSSAVSTDVTADELRLRDLAEDPAAPAEDPATPAEDPGAPESLQTRPGPAPEMKLSYR